MKKLTKEEVKVELKSALYTFIATFIGVVCTQIGALDLETVQSGVIVGILLAGVRSGVKAVGVLLSKI